MKKVKTSGILWWRHPSEKPVRTERKMINTADHSAVFFLQDFFKKGQKRKKDEHRVQRGGKKSKK